MTFTADGTLLCDCGNTPDGDGFAPCDAGGTVDESLLNADSTGDLHYVCNRCEEVSPWTGWMTRATTVDRYVVIIVDMATGNPRKYGTFTGESGCDLAHKYANRLASEVGQEAFVVGLR